MTTFSIVIVSHPSRDYETTTLNHAVGADAIITDTNGQGGKATHTEALAWGAMLGDEWVVILEDDAQPCPNFRDELTDSLANTNLPVMSLYLGTGRWAGTNPRSHKPRVQALINAAGDSPYIITDALWHGVGYAIRANLVPGLVEYLDETNKPIDEAITAHFRGQQVAYAWPSLVDHADGPTVTKHRDGKARREPRKAWRVRGREH